MEFLVEDRDGERGYGGVGIYEREASDGNFSDIAGSDMLLYIRRAAQLEFSPINVGVADSREESQAAIFIFNSCIIHACVFSLWLWDSLHHV
jgi:hypothetical protein